MVTKHTYLLVRSDTVHGALETIPRAGRFLRAVWLRYGTPEARSAYDGASFWVAEDGSLCVKVTTLADGAERPAARDIALSDPEIAVLREIVGEP